MKTRYTKPLQLPGSIVASSSRTALSALPISAAGVRLGFKHLIRTTALLAFAGLAFAGPKLAPDLPKNSTSTVDVIVQFKNPPTKAQLKQLGPYGQMKKIFTGINAVHISLPMSTVLALESDPSVVYISPDRPTAGSLDVVAATVNATMAWQSGWDGTGVGVAVIDSGVTPKNDLMAGDGVTSRVVYSESFIGVSDTTDGYGHGTHVAGIVGANGKDSSGVGFTRTFRGIAPNVNLINLRVLDQNGAGTESGVIAAIDRAIQLKNTYNIRIINLSLGHPVYESYKLDPLCQEVEAAYRAGITVVVAAGNYGRDSSYGRHGYGTIASPGNDPYVITVGATKTNGTTTRNDDTIASYSSKGPTMVDHIVKPDLVAPGNGVVSLLASPTCTLFMSYPKTQVNTSSYETLGSTGTAGSYFRLSGTSMATPVVSGAVALMLQKQPSLTPDQVKARLMKTATRLFPQYSYGVDFLSQIRYDSQSDIFAVGAGYLDINAALASTDLATLPALSPVAVFNSITRKATIMRDFSVVWGDSLIWGDSVIWGGELSTILNGSSVIWGDSVVWGDCTISGFSVIWGGAVDISSPLQASSADDGDLDTPLDPTTGAPLP